MNRANGMATSFPIQQNGYKKRLLGRNGEYVCRPFPYRNASDNGFLNHEKYQDNHDFCLGHRGCSMIFVLCGGFKRIFCHHCIKKLAEIICNTNNSITLLLVIMAIISRNSL